MEGWGKVKSACKYADVSERTLRGEWLKMGLRHCRLPSGTILIKFSDLDDFLRQFEIKENEADKIVSDILGAKGKK